MQSRNTCSTHTRRMWIGGSSDMSMASVRSVLYLQPACTSKEAFSLLKQCLSALGAFRGSELKVSPLDIEAFDASDPTLIEGSFYMRHDGISQILDTPWS